MRADMKSIISVVLSGGAGTRLWPVSREGNPKPFMKLADGETLLGKTYARVKAIGSKVLTVTNRDHYLMSRDELELAGMKGGFILEPFGRNTAPAVALAAKYVIANHGIDAVMLILPADHLIQDQGGFVAAVNKASNLAEKNYLVTFGIVPTKPETGFGYIELGKDLGDGNKVAQFIEKPELKIAEKYLSSGNYLWNSGMFCFKASVFLAELAKHAPEILAAVDSCWSKMQPISDSQIAEVPVDIFKATPNISIDYAVLEKSKKVVVVTGHFGWSDIGSWDAIRKLTNSDKNQNQSMGEAIFIDSKNTFVQSENRLVATVGIKDLMIIDTADALLVAHSDKVQDVKKVVAQLKEDGHDAFRLHRTVIRPWGMYTVLEETTNFKIKRIEVKPGGSLSLQMHNHRSEHWVVVSGSAKVTNGDKVTLIQVNESTYIPAGQKHRLENAGIVPCVMIEVQCGSYLGEDDIVRFNDRYGR